MNRILYQIGFGCGFLTSIINIWIPISDLYLNILLSCFLIIMGLIVIFYYNSKKVSDWIEKIEKELGDKRK